MSAAITVTPPAALERLGDALARYQAASGRTAAAVLAQKGAQILHGNADPRYGATFPGLVELFLAAAPAQGSIRRDARLRGFRLGRRALGGALSPRALSRASAMMGGEPSVLISPGADGTTFRFVRRGLRQFKRGGPRRVHFRYGRLSYAVGPTSSLRRPTDRVLNFRAVATYFELVLREHGRRLLAVAWLHRRWRRLAQSDPRRAQVGSHLLQIQNPRSTLGTLGTAELSTTADTATLRLASHVPGTAEVGARRLIFSRVMLAVTRDIDTYLARHQQAQLAGDLRTALSRT